VESNNTGFVFKQRHVISEHPEYFCCMDEHTRPDGSQMLLLHMDVDHLRFTPGVLKTMLTEWQCFRGCTEAPIFVIEDSQDDGKWEHFVSLFGFKFSQQRIPYSDGSSRRVFVSIASTKDDYELKNKNQLVRELGH
jgi:hypothetical protein